MEVKIHRSLLSVIEQTLQLVFYQNKLADKEIPKALKHKQFGSRDRAFLAETMYDIVRWKLKYEYYAKQFFSRKIKVPDLVLISLLNRKIQVKNIEIFDIENHQLEKINIILDTPILEKNIEQSYSSSFYDYCLNGIGQQWNSLAKTLNEKAVAYIKINSNKITTEAFSTILQEERIKHHVIKNVALLPEEKFNTIAIFSKNNLMQSDYYKKKYFRFQDIGSQYIGHFIHTIIKTRKQVKILDMCAGVGGKTLHLSELIGNNGKIYSSEIDDIRYNLLRKNTEYSKNITCIPFKEINKQQYDIVFIDAPCSGSGTFRRQPDLKYKIDKDYIQSKVKIQQELLEKSTSLIAPNGIIVYVTCSILPVENELQIQQFLNHNITFQVIHQQQILPEMLNSDGFFLCALKN